MRAQRGITMIEVLVIFALLAIVGGFALFVSMDTLRGTAFRSDRDLIVSMLQRARAQSMNNICIGTCTEGRMHGVEIDATNKKVILFQTTNTYGSGRDIAADSSFDLNGNGISGSTEVEFAQLSGNVASAQTISVTDASGHASTITVNTNGQIVWTN